MRGNVWCTFWWGTWCKDGRVRTFWLRGRSLRRGLRQLLRRRVLKWDTLDRFHKLAEQLRLRKGCLLDLADYKVAHKFCPSPFLSLVEQLCLFCSDLLTCAADGRGRDAVRGSWAERCVGRRCWYLRWRWRWRGRCNNSRLRGRGHHGWAGMHGIRNRLLHLVQTQAELVQ